LQPSGFLVDTTSGAASAREKLISQAFDVHIIDLMLPDGSGMDLMLSILERDPWAVCIIITGFGSIEMAMQAMKQGAYDFLAKPFTSDELLVSVQQALERKRLRAIEAQTEQMEREKEELERLDMVKSQLMLRLAHEVRAPIAAVQSYINLILAGYVGDDEMKPTLSRVQERLQETLDLVADLLELSQVQHVGDQRTTERCPQDVAEILLEVSGLLGEQARQKRQNLKVEIQDRPLIVAERGHIRAIWMNLLSNAIKYTPEGGHISVLLRVDNDTIIGAVKDSGIGVAEADLPNLFQEFFRTDEARAGSEMGTGLGLPIVKQILDVYRGQIEVTSETGQGSLFRFTLPLEPHPEEAPKTQVRPSVPLAIDSTGVHSLPEDQSQAFILGGEAPPAVET
jgi:signal transduction histidine kinase